MKRWTSDEMCYLEDKWGTVSIPSIAQKLGRSVNAVKIKASKLRLGPHLLGSDKVSAHVLITTILGYETGDYTMKRWIRLGLPVHRHKVQDCYVMVVDVDKFWRWAETQKGALNFSRFEEGALGAEPAWVGIKRKHDQAERRAVTPWSKTEDMLLEALLKQRRHTYLDLAAVLRRSQAAIKRRIYDLCLDEKPVRTKDTPWTPEQEVKLMRMLHDGRTWDAIGAALHRTGPAARARYELMEARASKERTKA